MEDLFPFLAMALVIAVPLIASANGGKWFIRRRARALLPRITDPPRI